MSADVVAAVCERRLLLEYEPAVVDRRYTAFSREVDGAGWPGGRRFDKVAGSARQKAGFASWSGFTRRLAAHQEPSRLLGEQLKRIEEFVNFAVGHSALTPAGR